MEIDEVQPRFPVRVCVTSGCGERFLPVSAIQTHCSRKCTNRDKMNRFHAKQKKNQPPPGKPPKGSKSRRIDAPGQVVMFQAPEGQGSGKERAAA